MKRLVGIQPWPAPSLADNDNLAATNQTLWRQEMKVLNQRYNVTLVGGYPGAETEYLQSLTHQLTSLHKTD